MFCFCSHQRDNSVLHGSKGLAWPCNNVQNLMLIGLNDFLASDIVMESSARISWLHGWELWDFPGTVTNLKWCLLCGSCWAPLTRCLIQHSVAMVILKLASLALPSGALYPMNRNIFYTHTHSDTPHTRRHTNSICWWHLTPHRECRHMKGLTFLLL